MSLLTFVLRLIRWFKGHPVALAAISVGLLVEMGFNAFVPMAFQHLIDDAITPRNSTALVHVLVALGIATLVTTAVGLVSDYIYSHLASRVVAGMRQRMFEHVQTLSRSFFQKYSSGEIASRYSTDFAAVEQTLASWIPWGWKPALDVIGFNVVMFTVDWRLALLAQLIWPMALVGPRFFAPRASRAADERKGKEAAILIAIDEATGGRDVVRAFGLEQAMAERFREKVQNLASTVRRGAFLGSALERSSSTGILISQIIVLGVGAAMAFRGSVSIGGLAAFYSVFTSLSYALLYLAQYSTSLINSAAGLARIEEVLAERSAVGDVAGAKELPPIRTAIQLRDYVFAPEPGRRILDGVTLTIRHGQRVALVGPSGSGKSTVLNAVMRSFDPDHGSVQIDGHDLRSVTRSSFIRQSAVVFQESFLYNSTIRENVRLGRIEANDLEIEAACRDAEIHEMIMAMPKGYDSPVGERGSLLSGGQKQRLAIARALLRNPRLLFLDEATSALDPRTEIAINATVERLAHGRTVISVTHRLASTTTCDCIFVMNNGQLAESGTHAELLAHGGTYATLWRKQEGIRASEDGTHADITVERLKKFPILAHLDDEALHHLAHSQFVSESVPPGRDVVVEGDRGEKFYIIARGRVAVLKRQPDGSDRAVNLLEDGDNFGELALIRDTPRSATIRTLIPCIFLTLQRKDFQALLDHSPEVRSAILAQEAERSTVFSP